MDPSHTDPPDSFTVPVRRRPPSALPLPGEVLKPADGGLELPEEPEHQLSATTVEAPGSVLEASAVPSTAVPVKIPSDPAGPEGTSEPADAQTMAIRPHTRSGLHLAGLFVARKETTVEEGQSPDGTAAPGSPPRQVQFVPDPPLRQDSEQTAPPPEHEAAPEEATTLAVRLNAPSRPSQMPAPIRQPEMGESIGSNGDDAPDTQTLALRSVRPARIVPAGGPSPAKAEETHAASPQAGELPESRTIAVRKPGTSGLGQARVSPAKQDAPAAPARPVGKEIPKEPDDAKTMAFRGGGETLAEGLKIPSRERKPTATSPAPAAPSAPSEGTRPGRRDTPIDLKAPFKASPPPPPPTILGPASSKPLPVSSGQEVLCPRCGAKLINPDSLGLCQVCGYCRSLEEGRAKVLAVPAEEEQAILGRRGRRSGFHWLAESFWLPCFAVGAVALFTHLLDRRVDEESVTRTLWATGELIVGVVALFVAQWWALVMVAPREEGMGIRDLFLPARLWILTLIRLPETRWPVSMAAAGWALVACAVFWIGGLELWYSKGSKRWQSRASAAISERPAGATIREALVTLKRETHAALLSKAAADVGARAEQLTKSIIPSSLTEDVRDAVQCVVLGYVSDGEGSPVGLLLATMKDGKLSYAGMVRQGVEQVQELKQRLDRLEPRESPIGGLSIKAVWVQPKVLCEVHSTGLDDQGFLKDPNFKSLLSGGQ